MPWPDRNPPATDVLLHLNVPCSGGGSPAYLKIDKLPDGRYRLLTLPERSVTTAPRLAATETNANSISSDLRKR